jgi:hypothetical protein
MVATSCASAEISMNLTESWQRLSECMVPNSGGAAALPLRSQSGRRSNSTSDSTDAGMWHALFSDRPRPLLLPANNRRARRNGMRFFLPQLWRQCYAHARLQAHDLLGERARLPLLTLPSADLPTLSEYLALTEAPQLAFLIGTPGPYQKASMLVMSSQGEPVSLVKIALRTRANAMVQAEAAWLRQLNADPAMRRSVPRLLQEGSTSNGYEYLAQSIVDGRPCNGDFTAAHADFLRALGTMDCRVGLYAEMPICHSLHASLSQLSPSLSEAQYKFLHAALTECTQRLNDWRGPFVIGHGDFAYWNIRVLNDRVFAFDWEYAMASTLPLFDLLHFHLIAPAASGRPLGARDIDHALTPARSFAMLTYPDFDWSPQIVAAQGLAYLLHTLLFYGASRGELLESDTVVRAYCKLIEERAAWLP